MLDLSNAHSTGLRRPSKIHRPLTDSPKGVMLADEDYVLQKHAMKIVTFRIALLVFLACATPIACFSPAIAKQSAYSTPDDRQRFVLITKKLEQDPLDHSLREERKWALKWLANVPDIKVVVCMDPLTSVPKNHFPYADEIIIQYAFGMAAFIIENPEKASDPFARQQAGVESALNAYRTMRIAHPDHRSPVLESWLARQSRGELPEFVRKAFHECLAQSGK